MTIVLIITSLVALNFFLLVFSCNKITKKEVDELKATKKRPTLVTSQLDAGQLASTGS